MGTKAICTKYSIIVDNEPNIYNTAGLKLYILRAFAVCMHNHFMSHLVGHGIVFLAR